MVILYLRLPFALTVILLVSTLTSCKVVESFVSTRKNFFLKGHVMQRQRTSNSFSCAHLCSRKEGCRSYNFKHFGNKGLCELSSETAGYFEEGLSKETGWVYGQIVPIGKENSTVSNNPDFKFTFTTLGAQGSTGPTDTSGYQGTTLQGKVTLNNGIHIWQVPMTGSYVIEAWGASGAEGRGANGARPGGKGAYMKGTFNLTSGTLLKILVGQAGSTGIVGVSALPGGGGGGTFITSLSNTALIVAGGGGGGGAKKGNDNEGDPRQVTEEGSRSGGSNGTGGTILRIGSPSGSFEAGAGGGLIGDGESAINAKGGKSFVNGGEGEGSSIGGMGGFGGSGGGFYFPGAGGGYSGGGVVDNQGQYFAGGGGSFNNGGSPIKKEGVKEGDGKVIITLVDPELQ